MSLTTGTFSGTGQSGTVSMEKGSIIAMDFAGTASVNVEMRMPSGAWHIIETITEDYSKVWDGEGGTVRLNCTAHTDNVEYSVGYRIA